MAAAGVVVPLLLLLYFLKLRRQMLRIPTTLLWRESTQDLQVNVPFQRLRPSLLLFLQLLLLATLLAALAQPVLQTEAPPSARVILLIDRSASMNATDAEGKTRLEAARAAAEQIAHRLGRGDEPNQMMVVAFASTAQVITGFESDRRVLSDAIASITPTDEEANLDAALELAGAFASREDAALDQPPTVVLISDGGVGEASDSSGFSLPSGVLRFVRVGPGADQPVQNVGIVSFSARRNYQDPARVLVFARLANAGSQPIETLLTLRVDGSASELKQVQIPPAGAAGMGQATVTFAIQLSGGAVLALSSNHRDDLAADDAAALVLAPPAAPRIALVHGGDEPDAFLYDLISALDPQRLVALPLRPDSADELRPRLESEFDLVVFDRAPLVAFPEVPTLSFAAAPSEIKSKPARDPGGKRILSWDRQHPIMRHVSLDALVYAGFGGYELPDGAVALATGPDGPVIALVPRRAARHVLVGFELAQSNWPVHVSNLVFLQNVLEHLTLGGLTGAALSFKTGEPITVPTSPLTRELMIRGPVSATVQVEPAASAILPQLRHVGLYEVDGAEPPFDRIAVNLLSETESDIRPRTSVTVNAQHTQAGAIRSAAPLPLWPWLAAAAFALLVLEWIVYCRRMRG